MKCKTDSSSGKHASRSIRLHHVSHCCRPACKSWRGAEPHLELVAQSWHTHTQDHAYQSGSVCTYDCMCIYIFIYLFLYGNPPMNYRPSLCIVNTVSNQRFRQVRILYLSKTTENKLRLQENVSVNSFRFDVRSGSCISQGLLKSMSISTERVSQLIQVGGST